MNDETENVRREMVQEINSSVSSDDPNTERARLEQIYGRVWNTAELSEQFKVIGFMAPFVAVEDRNTGVLGSLEFQHYPRFYFNYKED